MEKDNYLEDLSEIRSLMNRSSRFISLSGLSGILAGIYALIGATIAYLRLDHYQYMPGIRNAYTQKYLALVLELGLIGVTVAILAIATGIWLTSRKANANGESIWNASSKRLLINFLIPLITGGIFIILMLINRNISIVAPSTLIFYGLACVNASKYTLGDIRYLGIANIVTGLFATQFVGYGLYFWAIGFGIFHIFYGAMMYVKYDRQK
ncbi:hypothetical protein [Ascidiimonas sp. W6]|uniref:hypothetical protein n=1 Tax=Ascidiimonas meishanensis TaxID=3128903 RepID=UPI0030EED9F5